MEVGDVSESESEQGQSDDDELDKLRKRMAAGLDDADSARLRELEEQRLKAQERRAARRKRRQEAQAKARALQEKGDHQVAPHESECTSFVPASPGSELGRASVESTDVQVGSTKLGSSWRDLDLEPTGSVLLDEAPPSIWSELQAQHITALQGQLRAVELRLQQLEARYELSEVPTDGKQASLPGTVSTEAPASQAVDQAYAMLGARVELEAQPPSPPKDPKATGWAPMVEASCFKLAPFELEPAEQPATWDNALSTLGFWDRSSSDRRLFKANRSVQVREHRKRLRTQRTVQNVDLHKKVAMLSIQSTRSAADMLSMLQIIEEDWMVGLDSLAGNIYRAWAFGSLPAPTFCDCSKHGMYVSAKFFGALVVWLIQLIGPLCILIYFLRKGGDDAAKYDWHKWTAKVSHWADGLDQFCTNFLAVLFIFVFNLNCVFVVIREADAWEQSSRLFKYLGCSSKIGQHGYMLNIGAVTNCYLVIMCCIDTMLILGISESPADVLMNCLALFFIYNLDDLDGDLAFMSEEEWPGQHLSWLYEEMLKDDDIPQANRCGVCAFMFTAYVLVAFTLFIPVFYTITDFASMTG